jgi:hypothetical protein
VDFLTLLGSLKYRETVGREMPLAAENSSMFRILGIVISVSRLRGSTRPA